MGAAHDGSRLARRCGTVDPLARDALRAPAATAFRVERRASSGILVRAAAARRKGRSRTCVGVRRGAER